MKTLRQVGIVGYGAYVPMYRLKASEVNRVWGGVGAPVEEKSVVALDEDTVTISVECAKQAVKRSKINPADIGAVYVGTESKPYAVKPSGTIVAEAIGATPNVSTADYEFACKAGTEAMQNCIGLVGSGMYKYAMAIGADTAQGKPADALEYTAACGGAAYIFAERSSETIAYVEASYSYVTDTPDFWRRAKQMYPRHGNRFTGAPAYFKHIIGAGKALLDEAGYKPEDFNWAVFHQPNVKFPINVSRMLGFTLDQINPGLVAGNVGNTYAGSTPVGLAAILDMAEPGDRIFAVSYGSGAGSDAFIFTVQDAIEDKRGGPKLSSYIERKKYVDYSTYLRHRGQIIQ
ncbi:MAG: hydroxymethylglutaryl-CoA synthase [Candidatus Bathyarchaeota archaeon]|nr:hydroxymethylglutaryl-CoA synthase [Candidatus Bathyarchaeota archaeon]